jgi:hypothetical protein
MKMKNETLTLGYAALTSQSERATGLDKPNVLVAALRVRSQQVITDHFKRTTPYIELAEDVYLGDAQVANVTSAHPVQSATPSIPDGAGLTFKLVPLNVLALVQNGSRLWLADLDENIEHELPAMRDDGTQKMVKTTFVGLVPVSGAYAVIVRDSQTAQTMKLGYVFGSSDPEEFTVRGLEWDGEGNRTDEADETFQWKSWPQVALKFRERFLAKKAREQERAMAAQAIEAEELAENARYEQEQREIAARQEKENTPTLLVEDFSIFELLQHLYAKEHYADPLRTKIVEEGDEFKGWLVPENPTVLRLLDQAEDAVESMRGLGPEEFRKQMNSLLGRPVLA